MRVRLLFFGMLKDLAGRDSDTPEIPEGATLRDVLAHYEPLIPRLKEYFPSLALAVNQQYAHPDTVLHPDDEIALLPPVSGGAPHQTPLVKLVRERITPHDIVAAMAHPEDGAIVTFDGIVRNHSRNRKTLHLEYEAYEAMALKEMESLAAQAIAKFEINNVAIVHRLGRLEIGETSVLIAVASAHRAPAFDACRWLIDTLKRTVPIWKKEFFEGGAVWGDGEPFPPEILPPNS